MIPFGRETVTVLHRSNAGYVRDVLTNCSWRSAKTRSANGTAVDKSEDTTCRIPAGQTMPDVGDVLILGEVDAAADSEIELVRLLDGMRRDGVLGERTRKEILRNLIISVACLLLCVVLNLIF